jgi:hypothetical protein
VKHIICATCLVLATATAAAAAVNARPWQARTVPTRSAAFLRGLDVLADGRTVVLLERRSGRLNRLELRIGGGRMVTIDSSRHTFLDTAVEHYGKDRLLVAWRRLTDDSGKVQAFWWASGSGRNQAGPASASISHLELDAASDGSAILALKTTHEIFAVRRNAGGSFGAPQLVSEVAGSAGYPNAAVASGGRTVVAWGESDTVVARVADRGRGFGPAATVHLRPPSGGHTLVTGFPRVATTADRRAVVVVTSAELSSVPQPEGTPVLTGIRVEAFDWPARAASPSAARLLSGAQPGTAEVLSGRDKAVIAWTELESEARILRTVSWTGSEPGQARTYRTRNLGIPVVFAAAPHGATDVLYRVGGGHWFTVHLGASGRFSGTTAVTPPGESVTVLAAAAARGHSAAGWTVKTGRSNASWRVQIARPAPR